MRRKATTIALTAMIAMSMSSTALAAGWQKDNTGWWWQNDNGSYPSNAWQWLDGNQDGVAECYYFDKNGYCLMNTQTPDGYTVNADGAWVVNGTVQTKAAEVQTTTESQEQTNVDIYGTYVNPYDEVITLTDRNGVLILAYYYEKGGEMEVLASEMRKVNDTTYESTIYEAMDIKFTNNTTFTFYDGMVYTKQ